jgi:hypothetical protein
MTKGVMVVIPAEARIYIIDNIIVIPAKAGIHINHTLIKKEVKNYIDSWSEPGMTRYLLSIVVYCHSRKATLSVIPTKSGLYDFDNYIDSWSSQE